MPNPIVVPMDIIGTRMMYVREMEVGHLAYHGPLTFPEMRGTQYKYVLEHMGILSPSNCQYITTTDESGSYSISLDSPQ